MASLQKQPGSKNWYVVFRKEMTEDERLRKGTRKQKRVVWLATGTPDRARAEEKLNQVEAMLQGREKARETERMFAAVGLPTPMPTRIRMERIVGFYRETGELEEGQESRQETHRINVLQGFLEWVKNKRPDVEFMHEVTPQVANEYWRWLAKPSVVNGKAVGGRSASTRNNILSQLNVAWRTMAAEAGLDNIPWAMIRRDQSGSITLQPLTLEQVERLLWHATRLKPEDSVLDHGFWAGAIMMGFYTGLREGDIATFEGDEIRTDKDCIVLVPNKGKRWGNKAQVVHPLSSPWLDWVPMTDAGPIWPSANAAYLARDSHAFSREWKALCRRAGIQVERAAKEGERRRRAVKLATVHSLRHTFVTQAIAHNAEMKDVQATAGHSTMAMTELYNHGPALAAALRVAAVMPTLKPRRG